ncbi:unnamed protein product [Cylicostephanus goldi]|uniref:RING-type domain-containing protein n=1 Tax=Cylicostephanus goldi TaxID=71465 RepID=A0A3P6S726_CYLGO|nr:unnamed protein product [Cylicostephanus goldi]
MEECLRCQADASSSDCVVVWGDCNHAFHNCCMSQWVRQNNRCPLCQQDWIVQRVWSVERPAHPFHNLFTFLVIAFRP